jgi:hypothetical protein
MRNSLTWRHMKMAFVLAICRWKSLQHPVYGRMLYDISKKKLKPVPGTDAQLWTNGFVWLQLVKTGSQTTLFLSRFNPEEGDMRVVVLDPPELQEIESALFLFEDGKYVSTTMEVWDLYGETKASTTDKLVAESLYHLLQA